MSVDLDPQEVLHHLYSLGYSNITKEQLKYFIKDLKKLIKHDIRKEEQKYCPTDDKFYKANKENVCSSVHSTPTKKKCSLRDVPTDGNQKHISPHRSCDNHPRSFETSPSQLPCPKIKICYQQPPPTSQPTACSDCNQNLKNKEVCSEMTCQPVAVCETELTTDSEECSDHCKRPQVKFKENKSVKNQRLKPCPSFIRPGSSKGKPPKADPVALYHYYKTLWSQHTLPGESSHEDLRWRIRHKMMAPPEKICKCKFVEEIDPKEYRQLPERPKTCARKNKTKCLFIKKVCKYCRGNTKYRNIILNKLESIEIKLNFIDENINS